MSITNHTKREKKEEERGAREIREWEKVSSQEYEKEEEEKREKEEKKREKEMREWEKASDLKRIFTYHPETPVLVRIISFLFLLPSVGGLGILLLTFLILSGDIKQNYNFGFLYIYIWMITTLILSYGLSHLKRWSLYLFGILLIIVFLKNNLIMFGPIGLIGFVIVLIYYKKFRY